MTLKEFYLKNYRNDELGQCINDVEFIQLLHAVYTAQDVYEVIGVYDSVVRERLFSGLADILDVEYDSIYYAWLSARAEVEARDEERGS